MSLFSFLFFVQNFTHMYNEKNFFIFTCLFFFFSERIAPASILTTELASKIEEADVAGAYTSFY